MDDEIHVQVTVIFCEMVVCFMTLLSYEDFGKNYSFWFVKFISDLREVGGFLQVLRFLPLIKLTTTI